jgi:hypothetical protein
MEVDALHNLTVELQYETQCTREPLAAESGRSGGRK